MLQNLCGIENHFKAEVCTNASAFTEFVQGGLRKVVMILSAPAVPRNKLALDDGESGVSGGAVVETRRVLTSGLDRRAFKGRDWSQYQQVARSLSSISPAILLEWPWAAAIQSGQSAVSTYPERLSFSVPAI